MIGQTLGSATILFAASLIAAVPALASKSGNHSRHALQNTTPSPDAAVLESPMHVIVPCPVGSPADLLARAFARTLSQTLDRKVHVQNRPDITDMGERTPTDNEILFMFPNGSHSCGE